LSRNNIAIYEAPTGRVAHASAKAPARDVRVKQR
jgi:hypothetical protein